MRFVDNETGIVRSVASRELVDAQGTRGIHSSS